MKNKIILKDWVQVTLFIIMILLFALDNDDLSLFISVKLVGVAIGLFLLRFSRSYYQ